MPITSFNIGVENVKQVIETVAKISSLAVDTDVPTPRNYMPYSPEEALAFICRNDFSKAQYSDIRLSTLTNGVDMYPPYYKIIETKKECYPSGEFNSQNL